MSTRLSFTWYGLPGEEFTQERWDQLVGKPLSVSLGGPGEEGTLILAEVAEDGRSVRLTVEVGGECPPG